MALSATSGPMPVTSPSVMPIQPVIKVESCWLRVEKKNVPNSRRNLEQADERFLFQLLNPLLFELFLRLGAEGQLHVITHFVERFDLAGFAREGDVGEFLAQKGAFDPAPIATLAALRILRINGGHFLKRRAFLDLGKNFTGQAHRVGVVAESFV